MFTWIDKKNLPDQNPWSDFIILAYFEMNMLSSLNIKIRRIFLKIGQGHAQGQGFLIWGLIVSPTFM